MSSNKTIIPGMENAHTDSMNFGNQRTKQQDGTCVPNPFGTVQSNVVLANNKPVIGFLFSISKTGCGEYWPLRIGSNTIGRSSDSSICLSEATVSEKHAVLVIQQMKNPEKVIAWINDSGSTCGTMINGESLGFDRRECFNGDIITIGEHYDLYFILIDAKQIGLNVCREFMSTQSPVVPGGGPQNQYGNSAATNARFSMVGEQDAIQSHGGTVGLDETDSNPVPTKPGGTIFM